MILNAANVQGDSNITVKATLLNNNDRLLDVEKLLKKYYKKDTLKNTKVA